jgi:6-phosphogluconolactonase
VARLVVVSDARDVAEAAADRVAAVVGGAVEMRGVAHLALTGGSTAASLYRALSSRPGADRWTGSWSEAWWGDERLVDRTDPLSNARAPLETILAPGTGLGLDPRRIHPFPIDEARATGNGAAWIASTYAARLRERVPAGEDGTPILDLILLGMGSDGHILSCFPCGAALDPAGPIVLDVPAPTHIEPQVARVTLHTRLVTAARAVLVMCPGAAKAQRVAEVLEGPFEPERLPAQLARGPNATWILDTAAAAKLSQGPGLAPA